MTETTGIRITRDGETPLLFEGSLLWEGDTRTTHGPAQTRWSAVSLYAQDADCWVAHVRYLSQWQAELARSVAYVGTATEVWAHLQAHDPCAGFLGRPERTEAEARYAGPHNRIVREALRSRWAALLSEVAEQLGLAEDLPDLGGRPPTLGGPSTQVALRIPDLDLLEVDRLRGTQSRSDWVRDAIVARIERLRGDS